MSPQWASLSERPLSKGNERSAPVRRPMKVDIRLGTHEIEPGSDGVPARRTTGRETVPRRLCRLLDAAEDEPVEGVEIAF